MKAYSTLIIAEAGVNHNGNINMAKALIDAAAEAGVDYVKFQTFKADDLVSKDAKKADYQKKNTGGNDDSQYQMLKKLELSDVNHQELIKYSTDKGVKFFSTAFDTKSLEYLHSLGFNRFKVPSGEITNFPYLKKLAEFGNPVILSTGMANMQEIQDAIKVLEVGINKANITVLHCNTEYPTPMEDVNLKAMLTIRDSLGVQIGYSDHTLGIEVPIAAVALGATVIEKHFTLDRNLPGPDHMASLEPEELKSMVQAIRNIEMAISGDGEKRPSQSEMKNRILGRKSLFFSTELSIGTVIKETDLITLRPASGINAMQFQKVIGKTLIRNVLKNQMVSFDDFL